MTVEKLRLDVWLWNTRQFRTRSLATKAVRGGHVKVNDQRMKASYQVKRGDTIFIRVHGFDRLLKVLSLPKRRLGAPAARKCYVDNSPPRPIFYGGVPVREPGSGRPTKKERRALEKLRGPEWTAHSRRGR